MASRLAGAPADEQMSCRVRAGPFLIPQARPRRRRCRFGAAAWVCPACAFADERCRYTAAGHGAACRLEGTTRSIAMPHIVRRVSGRLRWQLQG